MLLILWDEVIRGSFIFFLYIMLKYYDGSYNTTSVQLELAHLKWDGNSATFWVTLRTEQDIEITDVRDWEISFIVNWERELIGIINVFKQAYEKVHWKVIDKPTDHTSSMDC